ncbi:putative DNA-binding transcriptional regulator YafY [Flavobacterium tiangeerense]|uniref:DNA-binding transcriptional regulator YafY n=1 Tax=Flavobacterium tiangeerense TaxID=459471 RepID=A0ABY3FKQ0_9FLAO|nr:WYL domain-containing protein [Flavobacterium tiangeerense]TWI00427.1 putative DNA-binding transcriptional regulator YafY [Flavobacterium tiangeerense]
MKKDNKKHLNSTQVYRTKILVELLKKNLSVHRDVLIKEISAKDLRNISVRTIQRYVKDLNEDYGIVITFNKGNKHYYLNEEKSVNIESFLSHIEILSTAELIKSSFNETNNALAFIEFENNASMSSILNFKIILEAIHQALPITFEHYSFYHLKEEEYTLKPYFLKQYQNRWYVIGETEKGYRTFGIDRIENISVGTKKFKSKTIEAKDKFSHVIGLNYVDHKLQIVKLSFDISQKPYLVSLPMHRTQKEINLENEKTFDIEMIIHPNFEFSQQILKYGSLVKVLEPEWLVNEIKEELRKGFEGY